MKAQVRQAQEATIALPQCRPLSIFRVLPVANENLTYGFTVFDDTVRSEELDVTRDFLRSLEMRRYGIVGEGGAEACTALVEP